MKHELKIKPEYFAAVFFGEKTFEIRNNTDRNFQVGDTLLLKAWDGEFNGDFVEKVVSYITDFEQKPGYVVLGLVNDREHELLEKFHRTGVAIERAISTGSVLADHPLKSRLELLANHHKREQTLADGMVAVADRCQLLADLLRELRDGVEGEWCFPDDLDERIDSALAGTPQAQSDAGWTEATTTPTKQDYHELQEQHDQLQSRLKVVLDTLKLALPYVEDAIEYAPSQQISEGHKIFAAHITAALTGDCGELLTMMQEQNPADALVLMSDIASLQRYTLGGHCDSFGQDCGAEMEQDDEGEYILLAEALTLPAAAIPSGGEPCVFASPSSSPD